MKVAPEIKSASNNIRYYVNKIHELMSLQFDIDIKDFSETIENSTLLGNKVRDYRLFGDRFVNVTGQIAASCQMIVQGCQNIERQLETAEGKQDEGKEG